MLVRQSVSSRIALLQDRARAEGASRQIWLSQQIEEGIPDSIMQLLEISDDAQYNGGLELKHRPLQ